MSRSVSRTAVLLLLAAALTVGACGGDDDSPPDSTLTPQATSTSQPEPSGTSAPVSTPIGASNAQPISVTSADGRASVDVPAGALPAGARSSELTVSDVTEREASRIAASLAEAGIEVADDDFELVVAYELGPDGLQFRQPISFSVALPLSPGALVIFVVSDGGLESVTEFATEIDVEAKLLTVSFPLDHFSGVRMLGTRSSFSVTLTPNPPAAAIGESIEVTAVVRRRASSLDLNLVGLRVNGELRHFSSRLHFDRWRLKGTFIAGTPEDEFFGVIRLSDTDVVEPTRAENRPPLSIVTTATFTATQSFTCKKDGVATVRFIAELRYRIELLGRNNGSGGFPEPVPEGGDQIAADTEIVCNALASVTATTEATAEATPATSNRAPSAESIKAVLDAPTTIYIVEATDADGDSLTYQWTGANCGTPVASGALYTWRHDAQDCDHSGVAHPDAIIGVLISDGTHEVRCGYVGASTGTGPACIVTSP